MAERSTAAVDVADNGGDEPLTAQADEATADGASQTPAPEAKSSSGGEDNGSKGERGDEPERAERSEEPAPAEEPARAEQTEESEQTERAGSAAPDDETTRPPKAEKKAKAADSTIATPELHSGHKLARRYRLEECITRLDGFSSWRAVDEKLRRAVGVHVLPADHPRARSVLAAARSAALLGDARFVMVLDAVEDNDLVYVVHEWLPDATELTALLAMGPLEPHEAYKLVDQLSQALAAAHREGLSHLKLTPGAVLRTSTGQYRIRGLAVNAALRGIATERPQRTDTEAIGALLYAALTQRWPYETNAYGLSGLPKGAGLLPPDQVRAGVHRGLSELAMRALVNDGATASRQEPPCTTPEELAKAVGEMPRIRPPEPTFATPPEYRRTTYQQGTYGRPAGPPNGGISSTVPIPPAPLESRAGKVLKWIVAALLITALGLGSWQIAEELLERDDDPGSSTQTPPEKNDEKPKAPAEPLTIKDADEFTVNGDGIKEQQAPNTVDGDPGTSWVTPEYHNYPNFGNLPDRKQGSGIIVDLGSVQEVSGLDIDMYRAGHEVQVFAAGENASDPTSLSEFGKSLTPRQTVGANVKTTFDKPTRTRYVLVHVSKLPLEFGNKYRGGITEIKVLGR
ncbi:protein kinase family protein [Streptomyces sp. NPDC047315]|uniref:protein kinase family protein n=1 Tax=Streptomyces sp. NPDC047315 TaxID=3155142 RepID=UPI0033C3E15F